MTSEEPPLINQSPVGERSILSYSEDEAQPCFSVWKVQREKKASQTQTIWMGESDQIEEGNVNNIY